jgi:ABC-2 type transport system ATP-binding protein
VAISWFTIQFFSLFKESPVIVIDINRVSKSYKQTHALHELTASIETGRLTGLIGPDGSGKTTLLRIMAGLLTPSSGTLHVAGLDITQHRDEIHLITGYMPQRFGLYEDLTVKENLNLYADLQGISKRQKIVEFERLLDFTQLFPFKDRIAGKLSGGMKQKLGLACALISQPQLLLLDEPSVGVDPLSRLDLWDIVGSLTEKGVTVVWSTAYLDEAERCDAVLLLNEGKLSYKGPPGELTSRIAERSFLIRGIPENRRTLLSEVFDQEGVRDGIIQGSSIRVVIGENSDPEHLYRFARQNNSVVTKTAPRFEDAFIDLLGGGPGGRSVLADKMSKVIPPQAHAVECAHLTKRFGSFSAADNVTFTVKKGEIFGLLGPNGAGKSTTFKMLCGLLAPTSGEAAVFGVNLLKATTKAKLQLGYMAQKFSLYGLLSVRQNLDFFAGIYGLEGIEKKRRIEAMIETFALHRFLKFSPDTLPLGYKQRLALACALLHRPPLLFLDEPTSGVDPITRREFWTHINGLVRNGVTVLVTTHFMDEAEYCDRIALMYKSRIIALDTPDQVKHQAASSGTTIDTMEDAFIQCIREADAHSRIKT